MLFRAGQRLPGAQLPIASLGLPTSDGDGRFAFTGLLADGDGFVWRDGSLRWLNSSAPPPAPTGAAPSMGLGDADQFVFRTQLQGADTLWSGSGPLLSAGDPAPGIAGATIDFNRRPTMAPDGTAFWLSGYTATATGALGRALYASPGTDPGTIVPLLRSGDLVDGVPIAGNLGLALGFRVSRNLAHLIHAIRLATGGAGVEEAIYVDGTIAAREGDKAGPGEHWTRFFEVTINNNGDYLFSASTDADDDSDQVLAHNGEVVLREGDRVDGFLLTPGARVLSVDLDDDGRVAHLWLTDNFGPEHLFFACSVDEIHQSVRLFSAARNTLSVRPFVRFADIAFGPALWLATGSDRLWVQVEVGKRTPDGFVLVDAIVEIDLPSCD